MIRLRRGLTYDKRLKLRLEVYTREVQKARRAAERWGLSPECRAAMVYLTTGGDPALLPDAHQSCKAEEHGGRGCLCQCHDVVPTGVHSRTLGDVLYGDS